MNTSDLAEAFALASGPAEAGDIAFVVVGRNKRRAAASSRTGVPGDESAVPASRGRRDRRVTRKPDQTGRTDMTTWRRSSYCDAGNCVQVSDGYRTTWVRDQANTKLVVDNNDWQQFVNGVKAGELR